MSYGEKLIFKLMYTVSTMISLSNLESVEIYIVYLVKKPVPLNHPDRSKTKTPFSHALSFDGVLYDWLE